MARIRDAVVLLIVAAVSISFLAYIATSDADTEFKIMVTTIVSSAISTIVILYACLVQKERHSPSKKYEERYPRDGPDNRGR